ncbi:AAA family ATPase [Pantoea sp. 9140]|uniref:AAA family ATPase n=1 Tax=Pantoea sp. 9140 TaxID=1500896 RepID=UPI0007CBDA20|nr:AAA family ATPase [Pantoea sp. 9140]
MKEISYFIENAQFDFGDGSEVNVKFIGEKADLKKTHITFIVGANGTGKSRILASLVSGLTDSQAKSSSELKSYRLLQGSHSLRCSRIIARKNGISRASEIYSSEQESPPAASLPSRLLAISNLVIDKFPYHRDSTNEEQFYHYLGVRQATNLTTTGSTDRAVAESVIRMLSDDTRLGAFGSWIDMVFGSTREIAFGFQKRKIKEIHRFLGERERTQYIKDRLIRRLGTRRADMTSDEELSVMTDHIQQLFLLLDKYIQWPLRSSESEWAIVRLATIDKQDKSELSRLVLGFLAASRIGVSVWPTLLFEARSWLSFEELSSGQQNLLSVGAKVIAYATPGSLIVIDEPEVSLNVVWQQRYVELLQKSLLGAPKSHVIIATHSPHMLSSVMLGQASIVTLERESDQMGVKVLDGVFEGWGSESVLYNVLQIPSASNYHLTRELSAVLKHIQEGGKDKVFLSQFINKLSRIDYKGIEPLELVVNEVITYMESLD